MPMPCSSTGEKLPDVRVSHVLTIYVHFCPIAKRLTARGGDTGQEPRHATLALAFDRSSSFEGLLLHPSTQPSPASSVVERRLSS